MGTINDKVVYEQTGLNYRYFLDWRYKIIAGYLFVLGALGIAYIKVSIDGIRIVLLLGAVIVSIVFWVFDFRNRELFWTCQNAAARMEKEHDLRGSFDALNSLRFGTRHRLTHGFGINVLVAGITAAVLYMLWFSLHLWNQITSHKAHAAIAAAVFFLLALSLELAGDRIRYKQEKLAANSGTEK